MSEVRQKVCSSFRKKGYNRGQHGQGMTEIIVVLALVAIAGILGYMLFGDNLRKQFGKCGRSVGGYDTETVGDMDGNLIIAEQRNLKNFSDDLEALEKEAVPPPPPPPPMAEDPMGAQVRHHIGDGLYGGSSGGGSLVNEGASFNVGFELTREMIDYANATNGGFIYLHTVGSGVNYNQGNTASINGNVVGHIQNGSNTFGIDVNSLGEGSFDLLFTAFDYSQGRGYLDDIELDNISITYNSESNPSTPGT